MGGDEFIVVLTGRTDIAQAHWAARRILSTLAAPFQQESYELVVTPSVGIAMYPEHGSDAQSLLKNAEGAMYEAKGYYRPQVDCIMFTRDEVPFCAVCRRAISRVIDLYTAR